MLRQRNISRSKDDLNIDKQEGPGAGRRRVLFAIVLFLQKYSIFFYFWYNVLRYESDSSQLCCGLTVVSRRAGGFLSCLIEKREGT